VLQLLTWRLYRQRKNAKHAISTRVWHLRLAREIIAAAKIQELTMFTGLPSLTHEQQQKAVERIQALMAQGVSSGAAIAQVAQEIRESHNGHRIVARFDDDEQP
jgi:uncharacterized protein YoaH (UPF0181 family)